MAERRWTREELIELATGRDLTARNANAVEVDPPAWLLEHAADRLPVDSVQAVALAHPEDRQILIDAFLASAIAPGELITARLRTRTRGYWHHAESLWLNLLEDEDVGVILSLSRVIDGPPIEVPGTARSATTSPRGG